MDWGRKARSYYTNWCLGMISLIIGSFAGNEEVADFDMCLGNRQFNLLLNAQSYNVRCRLYVIKSGCHLAEF